MEMSRKHTFEGFFYTVRLALPSLPADSDLSSASSQFSSSITSIIDLNLTKTITQLYHSLLPSQPSLASLAKWPNTYLHTVGRFLRVLVTCHHQTPPSPPFISNTATISSSANSLCGSDVHSASSTCSTSPPPSPSWRHKALAGDWRRDAGVKPAGPECVVGRVVLLPSIDQIPAGSKAIETASGNPWNHPMVITKVDVDAKGKEVVRLRTCTSFGGNGIAHKKEHQRHLFLEVTKAQLADGSDEFVKPTWVNCSPNSEMTIEFEHLCGYTGHGKSAIQFSASALTDFNKYEPAMAYEPKPKERRDSCHDVQVSIPRSSHSSPPNNTLLGPSFHLSRRNR